MLWSLRCDFERLVGEEREMCVLLSRHLLRVCENQAGAASNAL